MRPSLNLWTKVLAVLAIFGLPAAVLGTYLAFELSSQPAFCGTCHNMRPYYTSWLTSKHNHVKCVECHIPPGLESELRKKYEAMSMVTRYITGTYSTNPWAEVDDQSCLRSGCHSKRLLLGRELYAGVLFDHQPHLTEMRRGKHLRCTSCHSQIVQGSHISVTPSTCILCHFKNATPNTGTARCTLCHTIPTKTITAGGLSFNHGDVKRFDMNCMSCHDGVIKGDGNVLRERCFTCHNETDRVERYGETDFLHREHVTDHKVECMHCHTEIEHRIPEREHVVNTACDSCHTGAGGHSAVRDLYRGIGAKGVDPQPAEMFLAGVRCEACHTQPREDYRAADELSCMSCHGPTYLTIYQTWTTTLNQRVTAMRTQLRTVTAQLETRAGGAAALADAHANLGLLIQGHAIHNPPYAVAILDKTRRDVATALVAAGAPVPAKPWVEAPYEIECLKCHFGIEQVSSTAFGAEFSHTPHVMQAGLRCTVCHGDLNAHGQLKLQGDDCVACHDRIEHPMRDVAADGCLHCHSADIGTVSDKVRFPHDKHIASGVDCALCHTGVDELPHTKFARSPAALPKLGHAFCSTCHASDVPADDGTPPDGANCALCHIGM